MSQEAIRIPSAGAVFWAEALPDGSGGVRAIAGPSPVLKVTLTSSLPRGITARTGSRGIVLLTSPMLYDHIPTQADLATVPAVPPITLSGTAVALDGRFHPRQFTVTPAPTAPTYVPLRPSLQSGAKATQLLVPRAQSRWCTGTRTRAITSSSPVGT